MKNFLFPFNKDNNYLKKQWWHRLLIVLFSIVVLFMGSYTWIRLNQLQSSQLESCYRLQLDIYDSNDTPATDFAHNTMVAGERECDQDYPIHSFLNFSLGLVIAILLFYSLQVLYYKVVLYIIFGNKNLSPSQNKYSDEKP